MNCNSDFWSIQYWTFWKITVGKRGCIQLYSSLLTVGKARYLLAVAYFSLCWIPTAHLLVNPNAGLAYSHAAVSIKYNLMAFRLKTLLMFLIIMKKQKEMIFFFLLAFRYLYSLLFKIYLMKLHWSLSG